MDHHHHHAAESLSLPAPQLTPSCQDQVKRVDDIWKSCLTTYQSKSGWLFGETMTIADVMYLPVALRFVAYKICVSKESQRFIDAVMGNVLVQEWIAEARKEPWSIDFVDQLVPAAQSPLIL